MKSLAIFAILFALTSAQFFTSANNATIPKNATFDVGSTCQSVPCPRNFWVLNRQNMDYACPKSGYAMASINMVSNTQFLYNFTAYNMVGSDNRVALLFQNSTNSTGIFSEVSDNTQVFMVPCDYSSDQWIRQQEGPSGPGVNTCYGYNTTAKFAVFKFHNYYGYQFGCTYGLTQRKSLGDSLEFDIDQEEDFLPNIQQVKQ